MAGPIEAAETTAFVVQFPGMCPPEAFSNLSRKDLTGMLRVHLQVNAPYVLKATYQNHNRGLYGAVLHLDGG